MAGAARGQGKPTKNHEKPRFAVAGAFYANFSRQNVLEGERVRQLENARRAMRLGVGLVVSVIVVGCADLRGSATTRCGTFMERCPVPPDTGLVSAITAAWAIELDPLFPTRGPMLIGPGGDSSWTVAVYQRLRDARPHFFAPPVDTAHAPHLNGVTVEMLGDTARVTTSVSQCTTRETTFDWTESGMTHKFVPYKGKWALLPGSLGHLAQGKCGSGNL